LQREHLLLTLFAVATRRIFEIPRSLMRHGHAPHKYISSQDKGIKIIKATKGKFSSVTADAAYDTIASI
jgi:hypothetical protein